MIKEEQEERWDEENNTVLLHPPPKCSVCSSFFLHLHYLLSHTSFWSSSFLQHFPQFYFENIIFLLQAFLPSPLHPAPLSCTFYNTSNMLPLSKFSSLCPYDLTFFYWFQPSLQPPTKTSTELLLNFIRVGQLLISEKRKQKKSLLKEVKQEQ